MNRNFMIFNYDEIDSIDFNEVLETSKDTIRKSLDGKLTFVKWEGEDIPISIQNLKTKFGPLSYDEIIIILDGPEWSEPFSGDKI